MRLILDRPQACNMYYMYYIQYCM